MSTAHSRQHHRHHRRDHDRVKDREGRQKSQNLGKQFHFLSAAVSLPHPEKQYRHGEDASFQTTRSLGVFDGVGSWNDEGIDPGKYSKKLASIVKDKVQHSHKSIPDALKYAINENKLLGSSTICAAEIVGDKLKGRNVGDSGLLVVRDGKAVYSTEEQSRGFNYPRQVSYEDKRDYYSAEHINCSLKPGDIVIFGTDGLWDNMSHRDVTNMTRRHYNLWTKYGANHVGKDSKEFRATHQFRGNVVKQKTLNESFKNSNGRLGDRIKELALDIVGTACKTANSDTGSSPFAKKVREANEGEHSGGKMDDITIIVGVVVSSHDRYRSFVEVVCPSCNNK